MAKVRKNQTSEKAESRDDEPPKPSLLAKARRRAIAFLFQPKRLALAAIAPAVLLLVPSLLAALPDIGDAPEYQLRGRDIQIAGDRPSLVPHDLLEQVVGTNALDESFSILDPTLAPRLSEAFERHPWISDVTRVTKDFPPRVEVFALFRRPIAMIDTGDGLFPVDANAVVLPTEDFDLAAARRFPLVKNVSSKPSEPAGVKWDDPAVLGAARIAEALTPVWDELGLTSIRAPRRLSEQDRLVDLHFELDTVGGSRILWGRAPGSGHPGELTIAQKIGRLKKYLSDFGKFDKPAGPYEIDIRHWQEMTRRSIE
ncbi:cell division protein FtsQ/DivIB [Stratiformator vulcanicus]|nr:hypothetical protein [Stratiformator vulcanicus]